MFSEVPYYIDCDVLQSLRLIIRSKNAEHLKLGREMV